MVSYPVFSNPEFPSNYNINRTLLTLTYLHFLSGSPYPRVLLREKHVLLLSALPMRLCPNLRKLQSLWVSMFTRETIRYCGSFLFCFSTSRCALLDLSSPVFPISLPKRKGVLVHIYGHTLEKNVFKIKNIVILVWYIFVLNCSRWSCKVTRLEGRATLQSLQRYWLDLAWISISSLFFF